MKIVIIRHGQTMANILNDNGTALYTGTLNNEMTDLTELGRKQASSLVNNEIVKEIEKVYCSNLNRAIQTAELAKPGYPLDIHDELKERCLGIFEGKEKKDLLASEEYIKYITNDSFNKFRTDFVQKAPEVENYTDVSERCRKFLDSLDFQEDTTIGIFSHFHAIRCLFLNMFHIEPKEKIFHLKIEHCTPYVIEGKSLQDLKLIFHNLEDMFEI